MWKYRCICEYISPAVQKARRAQSSQPCKMRLSCNVNLAPPLSSGVLNLGPYGDPIHDGLSGCELVKEHTRPSEFEWFRSLTQ